MDKPGGGRAAYKDAVAKETKWGTGEATRRHTKESGDPCFHGDWVMTTDKEDGRGVRGGMKSEGKKNTMKRQINLKFCG